MTDERTEAAVREAVERLAGARNAVALGKATLRGGNKETEGILRDLIHDVTTVPCPECEKADLMTDAPCPTCHGTGRISAEYAAALWAVARVRKMEGDEAADVLLGDAREKFGGQT
jgi:hypothetical protein